MDETEQTGTVADLDSVADRLNFLFERVYPASRGRSWTNREVAAAICEAGTQISDTYLGQLRRGERDNPTLKHVEAIAQFFGVKPVFFFDTHEAEQVAEQVKTVAAMLAQKPELRSVALRAAYLSPEGIKALIGIIDQVRQLESGEEPSSNPPAGSS